MRLRWLMTSVMVGVLAACDLGGGTAPEAAVETVTETVAEESSEGEPTDEVTVPSEAQTPTEDETPTPTPEPSLEPTPVAARDALAATNGELPGVVVEVYALERSGETLNLIFGLRNTTGEDIAFEAQGFVGALERTNPLNLFTVSGVALTDTVNRQLYLTLRDVEDGTCVCSSNVDGLPAGGSGEYGASFAAPPPEVTEMTVQVPSFPPIAGIPVTEA